ncbi:HAD-IA family hydrolase [Alkaliphilus transvaalensis]|uniref:HAD-IA family hydrolase n=1 Tax=Alkaliphilus transvaalensis TaxID=114628 RepID=UPI00047C348C|nr:HAD-IA family hydrolase [Alkaliphilus transvaalensis]
MIKHVVFDFDGTIADSLGLAFEIYNEYSQKYHYRQVTMEELKGLMNLPIKQRLKKVGIPFYKVPKILLECTVKYRQLIGNIKVFDHILELVANLKKDGLSTSIISSNSVENIEVFLRNNEIDVFDRIISSNNLFGKDKTIKKYLKQTNLKADEIVYVGDELRDVEACKRVSVKMIAVTWGYDLSELLKSGGPDYVVEKPQEIFDIVKTLNV